MLLRRRLRAARIIPRPRQLLVMWVSLQYQQAKPWAPLLQPVPLLLLLLLLLLVVVLLLLEPVHQQNLLCSQGERREV